MCVVEAEAEAEFTIMVVFGAAHEITVEEVEDNDWPRLYVPRGGVAEFCAGSMFWRLLDDGPVAVWFQDRIEASAIIEAYAEAKRRRLN
jgi:hypothetical protein